MAVGAGILQQGAEGFSVAEQGLRLTYHHLDIEDLGPGLHHGDGLRVTQFRDEEGIG